MITGGVRFHPPSTASIAAATCRCRPSSKGTGTVTSGALRRATDLFERVPDRPGHWRGKEQDLEKSGVLSVAALECYPSDEVRILSLVTWATWSTRVL